MMIWPSRRATHDIPTIFYEIVLPIYRKVLLHAKCRWRPNRVEFPPSTQAESLSTVSAIKWPKICIFFQRSFDISSQKMNVFPIWLALVCENNKNMSSRTSSKFCRELVDTHKIRSERLATVPTSYTRELYIIQFHNSSFEKWQLVEI